MTVKEQLRANFPKTVNKAAPVFSALVANDDGTAAIESVLTDLLAYMKEWVSTPNVYEQSGDMLEKTVEFFSFIEKFTDESETSLKNRFSALFVRNHNTIWGNPYNVKSVFQQYFPSAEIYIVENVNDTNTENLIADGDFSEEGSDTWNLKNCAYEIAARFSKTDGIGLYENSILKQKVSFANTENKTYFLHFFMKGTVTVGLKNNRGQYWNNDTKKWGSGASTTTFTAEEWKNNSLYFFLDASITSVEVIFSGVGGDMSCIDYIRLFEKKPYASFSVVAHFEADSGSDALKLAPGNADPTEEITDYSGYDYFNQAFLTGAAAGYAQDIYNDLLNLLRAQGVKAYLEIVTKDYSEE